MRMLAQHHHRAIIWARICGISTLENHQCFRSVKQLIERPGENNIQVQTREAVIDTERLLPCGVKHTEPSKAPFELRKRDVPNGMAFDPRRKVSDAIRLGKAEKPERLFDVTAHATVKPLDIFRRVLVAPQECADD